MTKIGRDFKFRCKIGRRKGTTGEFPPVRDQKGQNQPNICRKIARKVSKLCGKVALFARIPRVSSYRRLSECRSAGESLHSSARHSARMARIFERALMATQVPQASILDSQPDFPRPHPVEPSQNVLHKQARPEGREAPRPAQTCFLRGGSPVSQNKQLDLVENNLPFLPCFGVISGLFVMSLQKGAFPWNCLSQRGTASCEERPGFAPVKRRPSP